MMTWDSVFLKKDGIKKMKFEKKVRRDNKNNFSIT